MGAAILYGNLSQLAVFLYLIRSYYTPINLHVSPMFGVHFVVVFVMVILFIYDL